MFWKKSKDDPDSAWKEQHDAIATNPLYTFINVQKKGTLIDIYNRTFDTEGTWALQLYIKRELEPFLYRAGKGQIIDEKEFKLWKLDKMRKRNPNLSLTAVDIKLFDDDFNKFSTHEACWDLKKRGAVGETALHLCMLGNTELHLVIARVLLELYPKMALDFYEADEYYGETALHIAIVNGDFEMVKLLVEHGADVNQRATGRFFLPEDQKLGKQRSTNYEGYAYYGEYPLAFAACFGHEEIYDYLLEHGARPNYQDSFGNTVLHMMVIANQITMLGYAVKHHNHKANMEIANKSNLTPLTLASKLGRNNIFKEFIELQRLEIWRYSNITCSTYPLAALDTIGPSGKTNWSAALIYITEGETDDHLNMLAGGVLKQLLYSKWKTYARRRFFERLVLAILHLIVLSIAIYTRPSDTIMLGHWDPTSMVRYVAEIIVCIACISNLLFQFEEIRSQGCFGFMKNQLGAPAKLMFNISCALILCCIPMRFLGYYKAEMVLLSLAAPLAWTFLLFFARGIPLTGPFVIMIYKMFASDMVRFVIIFVVFLVQFSQGFYFLFKDLDNNAISSFRTIEGTIMQLFQMTLGEFKYEDFDYTRIPILTKAVFAVFAILVPILLLNMLIAMMGNTYNQIISRSEKEWKRQWAKIIIVLERTFSPKQLKMYQDIYSSAMPDSDVARGLIVIKTSRKTKARQRKGAISNWKKLVNEIKALIKEQRRQGHRGPIDLTSEEVSEKLTERQLRKRRSTVPVHTGPDDAIGEGDVVADGLLSAMTQLAWEKDIDLSKGKAYTKQDAVIKEELLEDISATRTSSPGDSTPLLKDTSSNNVKSGMGVAKTNAPGLAPPATGSSTGKGPKSAPASESKDNTKSSHSKMHSSKVHPDDPSKTKPNKGGTTMTITKEGSSKASKKKPQQRGSTSSRSGSGLSGKDSRPPSGRSGSGGSKESKDSAFVSETSTVADSRSGRDTGTESRSGRVTRLAISTSRSSLNSASSLTSLLQAWDTKDKDADRKQDSTEF